MNCKDIHYQKDKIFRLNDNDSYTIINDNTIIVEFMHYCYSHAIMDFIFPIYWIIQDIKEQFKSELKSDKFNLFLKTPLHPNNLKIYRNEKLIGVFNELINLLEPQIVLFEFNIKNNLILKNTFTIDSFGEWISKWQRGVWNSSHYYPQRLFDKKDVYYNDNIIYNQLSNFVKYTKNKLNIENYETKNNLIIIERKSDRNFNKSVMDYILDSINEKINFNGIIILEDMNLKEQIELFSKNNIFIFRHGSCLINLLWIQNNSVVIDLDHLDNRKNIVGRICKLTKSQHHYLNYNNNNKYYLKVLFDKYI